MDRRTVRVTKEVKPLDFVGYYKGWWRPVVDPTKAEGIFIRGEIVTGEAFREAVNPRRKTREQVIAESDMKFARFWFIGIVIVVVVLAVVYL